MFRGDIRIGRLAIGRHGVWIMVALRRKNVEVWLTPFTIVSYWLAGKPLPRSY